MYGIRHWGREMKAELDRTNLEDLLTKKREERRRRCNVEVKGARVVAEVYHRLPMECLLLVQWN